MNIYVDYHDMLHKFIISITIFSIDSIVQFLNKEVICENKKKQKKINKSFENNKTTTTGREKGRYRLNALLDNVALAVGGVSEECVLNGWSKMERACAH